MDVTSITKIKRKVKRREKNMRSTISKFTQISICSVILAFVLISNVLADSKKLDGGKATWTGGEDTGTNKIYSQLRDNKKDSIRYKVTVWVRNDIGQQNTKLGTTSGVGASGQVRTTIKATHKNPVVAEKSGYKNFQTVK